MLRFINLASVLAALLFSFVVAIPFQPETRSLQGMYTFEIDAKASAAGNVQLFYDIGRGLSEADSQREPITANTQTTLHFPLPLADYHALRFDPLDRETHMELSHARIVSQSGETVLVIPPTSFHAAQQISSTEVVGDTLQIATTDHGDDPVLTIALDHPFALNSTEGHRGLIISATKIWVGILAGLIIAGALSPRLEGIFGTAGRLHRWALMKPVTSIAFAALLSMIVSSFPIIFAGKSLVSPNCGVALLYDARPALPGMSDGVLSQSRGSDIAALMWSHLPLSSVQHRALFQNGEIPLWDRYNSTGTSMLGQGISCFGDPLQWLPVLADGAAWAWDLKFLIAKWLFSFGIGLLVWRLTRHLPATIILTVSSQFIGFFVYRINHPAIFSLSYAPWILYCWVRIAQGARLRDTAVWSAGLILANWSELNSGTAKEAYMLIGCLNFSGALNLFASEKPWKKKWLDLIATSWAGVLFMLISSPVWLTFLDTLMRSYTTYDAPRAYQIEPGMLAGLFDEIFYRPFQTEENVVNPSVNFCILLGVLWMVVRWRSLLSEKSLVAFAISAVIPFALVYGIIPKEFIVQIPLLRNIMHVDNTFSCVLIILLSVAAGYGWRDAWDRLGSSEGKKEGVAVFVLLLGILGLFLGTATAFVRSGFVAQSWATAIQISPFVKGYAWSLLIGAAVGLGSLCLIMTRKKMTAASFLLLLLSFIALHWRHGLELGMGFDNYHVMPGTRADLHAPSPAIETLQATRPTPFRTVGFDDNFLPGWSSMYNIEGICGPDPLVNKYYRQIMECCEIDRLWDWRYKVYDSTLDKLRSAYDFLNIRYYLGYPSPTGKTAALLKPVISSDIGVYESPSAWPRAFFTDRMAPYNHPLDLARMIREGDGRPFAAIHRVESERIKLNSRISTDLTKRRFAPAIDYQLTPNTTSFTVQASGPGVIVLTEAYLKDDFRVTVNQRPVDYFRVNHAFKGILVDGPGTYHVTFSYWPRHFTLCLIAAAAGLVLLVASLLLATRESSLIAKPSSH